jgi:hypothetical protein
VENLICGQCSWFTSALLIDCIHICICMQLYLLLSLRVLLWQHLGTSRSLQQCVSTGDHTNFLGCYDETKTLQFKRMSS